MKLKNVSEGININKTSASKECNISHYWYFLNISFKLLIIMLPKPSAYLKIYDAQTNWMYF